jgi:hypothetical protein
VPKKKAKLPLSKTHPKLAKEADGWDPSQFTFGSNKKQKWKCKLGHNWLETPNKRTGRGDNCPYCSGNRVLVGFNDLKTTHPNIAKQAYGWDPTSVSGGSSKKLDWICEKKHIWTVAVGNRTIQQSGCPVCSGYKTVSGINDLQTLFPKLAQEATGWDPTKVSPGSNKKFKWKCSKGHNWNAVVSSRTSQNTGCPVCSNLKIVFGVNDLKTLYPSIARDADGWDPKKVGIGTGEIKNWKCKFGHKYVAMVNKRTKRNQGCPVCANKKIIVGLNDLATTHPQLAKEAFGWDPTTVNAGRSSSKKVNEKRLWKCEEGHIWDATPASRTNSHHQSGCPSCSVAGFRPDDEGFLYFLSHQSWDMYQIGISNVPNRRISDHKKLDWEVIEIRGPMDGHLTQQWETAILRMLKAKGADLSNSKIAGKFDGYSEAWSKSTFPVKSIKELMRLTEEFEEKK